MVDYDVVKQMFPTARLDLAFRKAYEKLRIERLLDPEGLYN